MRNTALIISIIFCFFAAAPLQAGGAPKQPERNAAFCAALEKIRAEAGLRSISAAVILPDGTVLDAVANKAGARHPVKKDTRFSIGSCTKTFTAASVFRLIENGKLHPDDTLQKLLYTPGILDASLKKKIDPRIRVRDLLAHRSGIDDYLGISYYRAVYVKPCRQWGRAMTLSHVGPPDYAFDHANPENNPFRYSNTNYILLGMILEAVSGRKVSDLFAAWFLRPLGLDATYVAGVEPYRGLGSIPGDMAVGYEKFAGAWIKTSTLVSRDAVALYSSTWTCGSMVSTARDMARWARHYYLLQSGGGWCAADHLKPGRTASRYVAEKKSGYGIIYIRHRDGWELWGHTGTIAGFSSLVFYIPSRDISVAVLVNEHHPRRWLILHRLIEYIGRLN